MNLQGERNHRPGSRAGGMVTRSTRLASGPRKAEELSQRLDGVVDGLVAGRVHAANRPEEGAVAVDAVIADPFRLAGQLDDANHLVEVQASILEEKGIDDEAPGHELRPDSHHPFLPDPDR